LHGNVNSVIYKNIKTVTFRVVFCLSINYNEVRNMSYSVIQNILQFFQKYFIQYCMKDKIFVILQKTLTNKKITNIEP